MVSKRKTVAGGPAGGWRECVFAWAIAALEGRDTKKERAALDKAHGESPLAALVEKFTLSPLEQHIVELLFAVERSIAARRAVAGPVLTIERTREVLADREVDAALLPSRALRKHALVDASFAGVLGSDEAVRLGAGLAFRLDGEPFSVDDLAPGLRLVRAEQGQIASRYLALVERELVEPIDLVVLESASWHEAVETGRALARRQGRSVVIVDAPACIEPRNPFAALRREIDLDGHALVLRGSTGAGDRFWALASALEGLSRKVAALPVEAPPPPPAEAKATVKEDGLDHIRRMAVRDAEMALGIAPRAQPRPAPPVAAPAPAPPAAAPAPPTPVVATPPRAVKPAPAAPPPRGQMPERIAAKLRARGIDPETIEWEGPAEPEPAAAAAEVAAPVEPAPLPVVEKSTQPYVEVPADAKPDVIAKIANTCPNPEQRVELIERLRGIKSPVVIATLRSNARSEHPLVRAAAESVMVQLFGANWNVTRPVPKPVQPPPSDDKDRGPPGGY
jgi:hypothetical protein